jgi:hypothetical protein
MSYQSISRRRHNYLRRDYLGNRFSDVDPLESYNLDVERWARNAKTRMHDLCQDLLRAAANPSLMAIAIDQIGRREILGEHADYFASHQYPWDWLRNIQQRILDGTFRRGRFIKVKIPKIGKSGFRTIEIPDVESRILGKNLLNLLTPLLDPDFYELSIGFRPKRNLAHGISAAQLLFERGYRYMVACDIRDAFGSVPKQRLIQILRSRLHQSPVICLIEELLDRSRKCGIPQGHSLSPLCMNVYLDHILDRWWQESQPESVLVRYADDIAVFTENKQAAIAAYHSLQQRIQSCGLKLKEGPEEAVYDLGGGDRVQWLGMSLRRAGGVLKASLAESAWDKLRATLIEAKSKQDEHEVKHDLHLSGMQWIAQKAIAIEESAVPAIAEQIRLVASDLKLDMSGLTDDLAVEAWTIGRDLAARAQNEVAEWLAKIKTAPTT